MAERDKLPPIQQVHAVDARDTTADFLYRSEALRATKELLEDRIVEEGLNVEAFFPLFSVMSKTMKLTFFEERDVAIMENLFEAEIIRLWRSLPPNKQNTSTLLILGQSRMVFHANLRRSLGTKEANKMNERIAQLTQMKMIMTTPTPVKKTGFFARLFGRK